MARIPNFLHRPLTLALTALLLLAGGPPLAGQGPVEAEVRVELHLRGDGKLDLAIRTPDGIDLPPALLNRIAAGSGVRVESEGSTELAWFGLTEPESLAILVEGRATPGEFSVRISMAPGVAFDDIWEVQYILAQAGIRRVRFVSGSP